MYCFSRVSILYMHDTDFAVLLQVMSFRNTNVTMKDLEGLEKVETRGVTPSPKKARPRSCVAYNMDDTKCGIGAHKDDPQNAKKRYSSINPKAFYALERLDDSEDYTDSLEHSPLNKKASKQAQQQPKLQNPDGKSNEDDGLPGETRFRKLQEKWELIVGKEVGKPAPATPPSPVRTFGASGKSKIPRLLTSPVKQSSNVAANVIGKQIKSPVSGIPSLKKPSVPLPAAKAIPKKPTDVKAKDATRRTSRVDQDALGATRVHTTRPSSLPYKSHGITSNEKNVISPHRRAASTSLPRPAGSAISRTPVTKPPYK